MKIGYIGKNDVEVIGYVKDDLYMVKDKLGRFIAMRESDIIKDNDILKNGDIIEIHSNAYGIPTRGMVVTVMAGRGIETKYDVLLEHNRCVSRMSHDKLLSIAIRTVGKPAYSNKIVSDMYSAGFRFAGNFGTLESAYDTVVDINKKVSRFVDHCVVLDKAYGPTGHKIDGIQSVWVKYADPIHGKPVI